MVVNAADIVVFNKDIATMSSLVFGIGSRSKDIRIVENNCHILKPCKFSTN